MKTLGNLLAIIGTVLFAYTVIARFIGEESIMGFTELPFFGEGFTAVGMLSGTACILLLAVIALIKSE
ncbi:MAG: hypothetical protein GF409_04150 [Candidatus Omnitrophica bacterium]|nr:hypothetical protein [Candidatus Omnitrophota bacterium]